jgi:hypothetical protein
MSWSIGLMGMPESVADALEKHSEKGTCFS